MTARKIDPKALNKLLDESAEVLIKFNLDANYEASSTGNDMRDFVREAIKHYKLTRANDLGQLVKFRAAFEKLIAKKYGVKFTNLPYEDIQAKYISSGVPQKTQVKSGFLDLLIGELNTTFIKL